MKTIIIFTVMLLFSPGLIAIQSASEEAEKEEILTLLKERDEEIKELLGPKDTEYTDEQRDRLRSMINDIIDFETMASRALGNKFDEISQSEREEFVSLFSTIVRDQSLNRLDIYRAEVTYEDIEVDNGSARVHTIAQLDNVRTAVDYTMEKKNSEWFITDMTINDVSTSQSYNRQFSSIIRQHGFDTLLDRLRRRAERT